MDKSKTYIGMLLFAMATKNEDMIHEANEKIMGEILGNFMSDFENWIGQARFLKGMYLAMAELFVETIKLLCNEDDLEIAESLRGKVEISMIDLRSIVEQIKGDNEK